MAHTQRREAGHEAVAPTALGLVARSGAEPRRAGQSRAGEADGEKQRGGASELGFNAIAHE
jgi:hypothetical protein